MHATRLSHLTLLILITLMYLFMSIQIMKLLIVQFSPASYIFLSGVQMFPLAWNSSTWPSTCADSKAWERHRLKCTSFMNTSHQLQTISHAPLLLLWATLQNYILKETLLIKHVQSVSSGHALWRRNMRTHISWLSKHEQWLYLNKTKVKVKEVNTGM
jgi:hypothetical protein